ncbi:MAG: hypothetical protein V4550_20050 [Gemmatimonadota bacterium]
MKERQDQLAVRLWCDSQLHAGSVVLGAMIPERLQGRVRSSKRAITWIGQVRTQFHDGPKVRARDDTALALREAQRNRGGARQVSINIGVKNDNLTRHCVRGAV